MGLRIIRTYRQALCLSIVTILTSIWALSVLGKSTAPTHDIENAVGIWIMFLVIGLLSTALFAYKVIDGENLIPP